MGVRGLTTFVKDKQRRLLEREQLHNCSLVIDAFGLLYYLYYGRNLDSRHGGEFAAFADLVNYFLKQLLSCNIKPTVIFDGPIDPDKLPCVLSRLQDTIECVSDAVEYQEDSAAKIMPPFAVEIFIHCLSTHHIPFATSLVEADSEIVAVANALDCPVLSLDSDYYIYKLRRGYIQFQHLGWENPWLENGRKFIHCLKYKVSNMIREYGISERNLPYLSILLGNDWIPRETFIGFTAQLPQARFAQRFHDRRYYYRIDNIMWWLSMETNENSLLEKLKNSLPDSERDEIMTKVTNCLDLYRNACDVTETLKILRVDSHQQPGIKKDIWHLVRTSGSHLITFNILKSKFACMPVPMSDPELPSPHACSTEIRTLFYRVLMRNHHFKTAGSECLVLQEYDNVEQIYQKSKTISIMTSLCPMCDAHHEIEEECNTVSSGDDVKSVLMILKLIKLDQNTSFSEFLRKTENLTFSQKFSRILDLVMVVTLFWVKKTSPKPVIICALVTMIAWSIWKRKPQDMPVQIKATTKTSLGFEKSEKFDGIKMDASCSKSQTSAQIATPSKPQEKILQVGKTERPSESKLQDPNNTEDSVVDVVLKNVENLGEMNPGSHDTKTRPILISGTPGGDAEQVQRSVPKEKSQEIQTSTKGPSMEFQKSLKGPSSSPQISIPDCVEINSINSEQTTMNDSKKPQGYVEAKKDENVVETKDAAAVQKRIDDNQTTDSLKSQNLQESEILNQVSPEQRIIKLAVNTKDAHENSSAVKQKTLRSKNNAEMGPGKKTSQIPVVNTALGDKKKAPTLEYDFFDVNPPHNTPKNPKRGKPLGDKERAQKPEYDFFDGKSTQSSREATIQRSLPTFDRGYDVSAAAIATVTPGSPPHAVRKDLESEPQDFDKTTKNSTRGKSITATYFLNQLDSMTIKTASGKVEHVRREFDVDFLHGVSEWLCILNATLLLHHMVEGQRSSFAIQDFLTSNILLHEINARVKRLLETQENMQSDMKSISDLILGRLQSLPEVQTSFKIFMNFLLQH